MFGANGYPVHYRGVVDGQPGLYFVGLRFLFSLASSSVGGIGQDAEHVARHIVSRRPPAVSDREYAGQRPSPS